jgi:hypothetical protein
MAQISQKSFNKNLIMSAKTVKMDDFLMIFQLEP